METIILVIHLLIGLALVGVVLMQRSEGGLGGLGGGGGGGGGASGGMGGLLGNRTTANLLTRATAVLRGTFHDHKHFAGHSGWQHRWMDQSSTKHRVRLIVTP